MSSEEVAVFFGPTASPVCVSTEGVLTRPFRAELVLATLQRSVVEAPPPPPLKDETAGKVTAKGYSAERSNTSDVRPGVAAIAESGLGISGSNADEHRKDVTTTVATAAVRRGIQAQMMTQQSVELDTHQNAAVSVDAAMHRNPSNISLLDEAMEGYGAGRAAHRYIGGSTSLSNFRDKLIVGDVQLEEDPDSSLLDGIANAAREGALIRSNRTGRNAESVVVGVADGRREELSFDDSSTWPDKRQRRITEDGGQNRLHSALRTIHGDAMGAANAAAYRLQIPGVSLTQVGIDASQEI